MIVRAALLVLLVASPAAAQPLTTEMPFDGLVQCLRDRLEPTGRVTAVNSAAGAMLDYAFDTVGADGKLASAHLSFTVEDHGTERTLAVAAASPSDAALANQYQKQVGGRCIADPRLATHGAP